MTITLSNNLVPLSHSLSVGRWDKPHNARTTRGTNTGQGGLKALANKVLQRDNVRDKCGTDTQKARDKLPIKKPVLSHEIPEGIHVKCGHRDREKFLQALHGELWPCPKHKYHWVYKVWCQNRCKARHKDCFFSGTI